MNPKKEQYICKIHGIFLSEPSKSQKITPFLQISVKKKAAYICFGKIKMKKQFPNYRYIISEIHVLSDFLGEG
jgi:hypothetical protein